MMSVNVYASNEYHTISGNAQISSSGWQNGMVIKTNTRITGSYTLVYCEHSPRTISASVKHNSGWSQSCTRTEPPLNSQYSAYFKKWLDTVISGMKKVQSGANVTFTIFEGTGRFSGVCTGYNI